MSDSGRVVRVAAPNKKPPIQVSYLSVDGEPVTADLDAVDQTRVVHGLPVRIPVSRAGQRNYSGWYWSSTVNGHLVYESLLERDRLLLADFCPDVRWIAAQPFWMRGYDGTRFRRHVPDIVLEHHDGSITVVDVKAEQMLQEPDVVAVLRWTDRVCRQRGWRYEVWSGANATELRNVRFLSMAKRSRFVDREARERVTDVARDGMTVEQVLAASQQGGTVSRAAAMAALLEQLWLSNWATDLRRPLGGQAVVTARGGAA